MSHGPKGNHGSSYVLRAFPLFLAILAWAPPPAQAQDSSADLSELSLEELMEIELVTVSVLGSHTHLKGERMVGYKYMRMSMDGNRDGTQRITTENVLGSYMVSPLSMTMEMHMIEVMYAPSDALTLMAMAPYTRVSMKHRTRMGMEFTTEAAGVGDVSVHMLYSVFGNIKRDAYSSSTWGPHRIILRAGLVLPTGSIDARDDLPAGPDQKLPYPMQVGSGTLGLMPGVVYFGNAGQWAWEVESLATMHVGSNDNGYALGDRLLTTFWGAREMHGNMSVSGRVSITRWSNVDGADSELNPMMVPTADPGLRAGERVDIALGLNTYFPFGGANKGVRLGLEAGLPIRERLDGPQLGSDFYLLLGWGWIF